jgi:hypothetical protein
MPPQEVRKLVLDKPFIPFRIFVSDGSTYDVHDPADIIVGMLRIEIGIEPDEESGLFKNTARLAPNHITRTEFLMTESAGETNNGRS